MKYVEYSIVENLIDSTIDDLMYEYGIPVLQAEIKIRLRYLKKQIFDKIIDDVVEPSILAVKDNVIYLDFNN